MITALDAAKSSPMTLALLDTTLWGLPIIAWAVGVFLLQGVALYKAARLNERGFFWTLLLFSMLGIYPAIYLWLRRSRTS